MQTIEYSIVRRRGLKSLTLRLSPGKGVVVSAPRWIPVFLINQFVQSKSNWINQHLPKLNIRKTEPNFTNGQEYLYFGEKITLELIASTTVARTKVFIENSKLIVHFSPFLQEIEKQSEIQKSILRLYLEKGIEAITEKVNFYSDQIGVNYKKITIKEVSSIWGSCTADNSLSFNRKLIMAPHSVVDYVVIHEVCHMVHRDHSSRFWALVSRFDPNFRQHRHWLRQNHQLLTL